MNIKELRRKNANHLLQTECMGVIQCFADKIERSHSQVSAFIKPNAQNGIGQKLATLIENAFDKPVGWLDKENKILEEIERFDHYQLALHTISQRNINLMIEQEDRLKEEYDSIKEALKLITNAVKAKIENEIIDLFKQGNGFGSHDIEHLNFIYVDEKFRHQSVNSLKGNVAVIRGEGSLEHFFRKVNEYNSLTAEDQQCYNPSEELVFMFVLGEYKNRIVRLTKEQCEILTNGANPLIAHNDSDAFCIAEKRCEYVINL